MFGNNNKEFITDELLSEALRPLNEQIDDLRKMCVAQAKRIEELEGLMATLRQPQAVEAPMPQQTSSDVAQPVPAPSQAGANSNIVKTYYLTAPSADGIFQNASEQEHSGSIYQLTTTDGTNGSYIMLSTPDAIAMAMISVSQFVKPACRIDGSTQRQARSIVTLEEGVAQREGDGWRVVKKATVRFD